MANLDSILKVFTKTQSNSEKYIKDNQRDAYNKEREIRSLESNVQSLQNERGRAEKALSKVKELLGEQYVHTVGLHYSITDTLVLLGIDESEATS